MQRLSLSPPPPHTHVASDTDYTYKSGMATTLHSAVALNLIFFKQSPPIFFSFNYIIKDDYKKIFFVTSADGCQALMGKSSIGPIVNLKLFCNHLN